MPAHELRTPLAGLKTQAQVALATPDGPGREEALRHIVTSVDRTSRIVRQVLALAALEAAPPPSAA
ncbi:histidine kinase dimerization/phospho-acceptor domain-containing protein [Mesorhizobium sp. Root172]|uniref:histidine kinase dimerization/phospho-acceptor domain-containing protein n=1 Tax=Mesorhizobium sp. Root172 TaxID=1736481 RepID=UPI0039B7242D